MANNDFEAYASNLQDMANQAFYIASHGEKLPENVFYHAIWTIEDLLLSTEENGRKCLSKDSNEYHRMVYGERVWQALSSIRNAAIDVELRKPLLMSLRVWYKVRWQDTTAQGLQTAAKMAERLNGLHGGVEFVDFILPVAFSFFQDLIVAVDPLTKVSDTSLLPEEERTEILELKEILEKANEFILVAQVEITRQLKLSKSVDI